MTECLHKMRTKSDSKAHQFWVLLEKHQM